MEAYFTEWTGPPQTVKRGGDVIAVPAGAQVLGSRRLSARPIVLEGPSL